MDEQVKDPTTIDEQIHILSERGMQVDADLARQWLRSVSYYRLSGYWYPYREQLESAPRMPVRADTFVLGSTFTEVAGLNYAHSSTMGSNASRSLYVRALASGLLLVVRSPTKRRICSGQTSTISLG